MSLSLPQIRQAVETHLPGRTVQTIDDLGTWIRQNYRITLDDNQVVFLKVDNYANMDGLTEKEAYICQLLQANGLPAPSVLAVDSTCSVIEYPFLIQERVGGTRLDRLLAQVDSGEAQAIYQAVGRFYRRLHAIQHNRSGFIMGAGDIMPLSPNDYMHRQVIVEIGQKAVEQDLLEASVYERVVRLSEQHLDWLKAHTPALIGGGLMWTIALDRDTSGQWQVVRLTDLHDMLYWDPAFDLAFLRYPPYMQVEDRLWQAFLTGYEEVPDEKRLKLYRLIQSIDAALNNYLAPPDLFDEAWAQGLSLRLRTILDEIDALS